MIYFRIDGKCVPKQRPRVTKSGHAFTPKETKDYEKKVRMAFLGSYSGSKPYYEAGRPVVAFITIHQQIPKFFSKKKVQMALDEELVPTNHNGDLDNFAKSILDSINGMAYHDDCQVVILNINKAYALEPYAEVTLFSLEEYSDMEIAKRRLP